MESVSYRQIEDYAAYWEKLNVRSVRLIEKYIADEYAYTDPFHDIRGVDAAEEIIMRYYSRAVPPKIKVTNMAISKDGMTVFYRWEVIMAGATIDRISGLSEVVFNTKGKVVSHYNFWDTGSQIAARLPWFKFVYNWLTSRI